MNVKERNFAIAVTLTVLDVVEAIWYGMTIWQAYAGVVWCRLLLLLFVAVWITSLANLWYQARCTSREEPRLRRVRLSNIATAAETEGADV